MMTDSAHRSDEEVIEAVRTKDRELYALIIERYQGKLLRYATNILRDEHKAADVVQESFIKAFVNLHGFDTKMKFSSWIYRIVHNEAMNTIARHKLEVPMPEDMDIESEEDIAEDLNREEERARVTTCLSNMPTLYAEPLELFYLEEKTYEEISDILRVPASTVGTRIRRAKKLMQKVCTTIKK